MHIKKQETLVYYDNKESLAKNIASSCVECSEHIIEIITARSIGNGHLNVFITEWFIEMTFLFGIKQKLFLRSHQGCSIKKLFLKISQYLQGNTCARVYFNKFKKRFRHSFFSVNIAKCLRFFLQSNNFLLVVESEKILQWWLIYCLYDE